MQIAVKTDTNLLDSPIDIHLSELKPEQRIKIIAKMQDHAGQAWESSNVFQANEEGVINTAKDCPLEGSYLDGDPWGLIWSMHPTQNNLPYSLFALHTLNPLSLELSFYDGNKLIARECLKRHILSTSVQRVEIENEKVTGILFLPTDQEKKYTGIVLIPGSVGVQVTEPMAALLAAKGFAVLLVAYSRYKRLPVEIYDLPIERFKNGIEWFRQHPNINSENIVGIGISKGSEGLLAAASYFPCIGLKSIIAIVPSHVIFQGIGKGRPVKRSSWSLFNEPMRFLPYREEQLFIPMLKSKLLKKLRMSRYFPKLAGIKLLRSYELALSNKRLVAEAEIPIDKIKCPITLISGGEDQVWPSKRMCEMMIKRLKEMQFQYSVEHWHYEGAGHLFRMPGLPTTVNQVHVAILDLIMGGQAKQTAEANARYWDKLIETVSSSN